jgi:hypothetical protein
MEEGRPSATATVAAMMRVAHLVLDDDPKIFQDSLALSLSGVENEAALQGDSGRLRQKLPGGPLRSLPRRSSDTTARAHP